VRSALEGLDGVQSATVSLGKDNAVVVFDSSKATVGQMKAAVKKAGYGVSSASKIEPYSEETPDTSNTKFAGTGTKQSGHKSADYRTMSIDQVAKITENPNVALINVHIPYAGEIPGTDEFIPFNQIKENSGKLPSDNNTEIVLYCRSGHMSKLAYSTLTNMGYTNVYDVPGGMNAWQQAGNKLLHKK